MKKLTKELNDKSVSELQKEAQTLREDIAKARLESKANPPKDSNSIAKKSKRLAVVLTLITQKRELSNLKETK